MENVGKRKPKGEVKFKFALNDEQKEVKPLILNSHVSVITGKAGSGKTALCTQVALDMFFNRSINRIILCRPAVSKEEIGFLPGDIKEKMDPYLQPIYDIMYALCDKTTIDNMIKSDEITIVPFAFMRGRTFLNSAIIVDEAQNLLDEQISMVVGRLGKGSKMMICGDTDQIDLKKKSDSAFSKLQEVAEKVNGMVNITLNTNNRHEILDEFYKHY